MTASFFTDSDEAPVKRKSFFDDDEEEVAAPRKSFFDDDEEEIAAPRKSFFDEEDEIVTQSATPEELAAQEILGPQKESFFDRFGRNLAITAQTTGAVTPEGAAIVAKQLPAGAIEGVTLGAVDLAEPGEEEKGKQFVREIGKLWGLTGPISAINKALAPVYRLARSSKIAPRTLEAFARITGAGATGATVATGQKYFKEGELPTKEELLKEGGTWMAIDAALQLTNLGLEFSQAVKSIARKEGVPAKEVLKKLWERSKEKFKGMFEGKEKVLSPDEIIEPVVEDLVQSAKTAEKEGLKALEGEVPKQVEAKPKEPVQKPEEKPPEEKVKAEEPEKPSITGYVRKPEPKTVPEKISHLEQKIQESKEYISGLKLAIDENKAKLEKAKAREEIIALRNGLDDKKNNLRSEKIYLENLKKDLKDLKSKKEASRVKVPLGEKSRPATKKFQARPSEKKFERRQPIIGKQQAAKRSEILKLFRTAFKDPIRLGKISQRNARGIHKLWERVTRLVQDNNVETAAHEIGHNLHTLLYGKGAKTPTEERDLINAALRPYLDELKPLALYEPYGMEGFAEFTRLYVTNPDVALSEAPKFYAKFEADLQAQYPELKNALLKAREYYEQYLQGTPESRIRAQTDYATDATFLTNLIDWIKKGGQLDYLKTQFLDDVFPAKRLVAEAFDIPLSEVENLKDERNLYRVLRVLKGAIGKADTFLLHETFDARTLKRKGRGLRQILRKLKNDEEYKEFNDYLIARRVTEKGLQNIETGISYGDAIITERKLAPKYKRLANLLDKYNDALLTYARDSGLLSREQYDLIKKSNLMYVPFQRVMEEEKTPTGGISGKLQAKKTIKQMKGSTRNIIAPIESIIKNTYTIIINAEKNMAGQVLAKLADMKGVGRFVERVPTPMELKGKVSAEDVVKQWQKNAKGTIPEASDEFWKKLSQSMPDFFLRFGPGTYPAGENIVTVFNNGKPAYYQVSPDLYRMWDEGLQPYMADPLIKILRIPARTLRAGAILNPKFLIKNVIRDTWGSWVFTRYGKDIKDPGAFVMDMFYSPLAMLMVAARKSKLYVEFMKSGGGMSTMQSLDRNSVAKKVQEVKDGYKPYQIMKWLRHISQISEEANRIAEFGRALEVEGETKLGKEIAAFAARDLSIDFAKMGLQTKAINQLSAFFNVTIQGTDKVLRWAVNPETRSEYLVRAIAFIAIPSLILAYLNKDDERVDEFYEEEKDFNFITFIGNFALKIPVTFETGVVFHGLTRRLFDYVIKKDPNAFDGFMGSIIEATIPNFIPNFASPLIEVEANKNFFTGAPIVPKDKEGLVSKYQYKRGTSTSARLIGRALTYMPGLGPDTRAKIASPAVIDHFINSWTGGLGKMVVNLADSLLEGLGLEEKVPGPEQTIIEKLGFDAFTARYPRASSRSIEKFYENYADATARKKSFKYATKEELESPEELQEAYKRMDALYDYPALERAYKAMQMSRRAINAIWNNPEIEKDVKQKMIDDLYLQQIRFAKDANESMELHRLVKRKSS